MTKNIIISLVLGIVVSAVFLYLAFRNVPFGELLLYLKAINYVWILPSVLVILIAFSLRVLRWRVILNSVQKNGSETGPKIGFWRAFHPLMIGFMLNCILPGRVGELARPMILQKPINNPGTGKNIPFSTGLATVAAERVFDLSLLILLFAGVLSFVSINPDFTINFGGYQLDRETLDTIVRSMVKLGVLLIISMIMISMARVREKIKALMIKAPDLLFFAEESFKEKVRERVSLPLVNAVENFAAGFLLLRSPGGMIICSGLSALIWGLHAFSYYLFSFGCPGIGLSYSEMTAVMVIVCFFIALPSVPGFWGLWEAGGVFALALFGVTSKDAAGFTLVNHVIQMFPVIIIGLISAMITGVNIWQVLRKVRGEG